MLPRLSLSFLSVTAGVLGSPMYDMVLYPPMYARGPFGTFNQTQNSVASTVIPVFDVQPVVSFCLINFSTRLTYIPRWQR
jgi:hypothetical protein